jgi:hypothetical protein
MLWHLTVQLGIGYADFETSKDNFKESLSVFEFSSVYAHVQVHYDDYYLRDPAPMS